MKFPIETVGPKDLSPSFREVITRSCYHAVPQDRPFLVHMGGIPGSGKSTLADQAMEFICKRRPTLVGFDRIMRSVREYRRETDPQRAFTLYEKPARAAGYLLLKILFELRANILLEHTASDPAHVPLLDFAKENGYGILMIRVIADPHSAATRILQRQKEKGQFTPPDYVEERLAIIERYWPAYIERADGSCTFNNQDEPEAGRQTAFFRGLHSTFIKALITYGQCLERINKDIQRRHPH